MKGYTKQIVQCLRRHQYSNSLDLLPPGSVSALSLTSVTAVIWRGVEWIKSMIFISATQTECWYNVGGRLLFRTDVSRSRVTEVVVAVCVV